MRRGQERAANAAENEEQSRLRVERLQALAASLSAALTVEEVAGVMVEGVPTAIGARGGALGLVEANELVIVDPRGAKGQTLRPGARFPLTARAPITTAAREGKPAWAQRRAEFVSRFPEGAALAPYASGAFAVPVFVGERLAGAMGFPFLEPDAITAEVRALRASPRISVGRRSSGPGCTSSTELARGARPGPRGGAAVPAGRDARGGDDLDLRRGTPRLRL